MNILFSALAKDPVLNDIQQCFEHKSSQDYIYGLAGSQKYALIASCYQKSPRITIILTPNQESIDNWYSDLTSLLPDTPILELPIVDVSNVSAEAKSMELKARRMQVLGQLMRKDPAIILVSAQAAMQKDMSRQDFENSSLQIELSKEYDHDNLLKQLVALGYENVDKVTHIGQFSARGGIVDIYPINSNNPVRIEFFDNEIDSIREFDVDTQRSVKNISKCNILPLMRTDNTGTPDLFLNYLGESSTIILDEPLHVKEEITDAIRENPEIKNLVYDWNEIIHGAKKHNLIFTSLMMQRIPDTDPQNLISVAVKSTAPFQRQFNLLCEELKNWLEQKNRILICLSDREKITYLQDILTQNHIPVSHEQNPTTLSEQMVTFTVGSLLNGFELPQSRFVLITEKDIMGRQKKKLRTRAAKSDANKISHFRDINIGDYVVHVNHGIGKYMGVKTLTIGNVHRDYLQIKYSGTDKLFVPTDQVHLIQKYIGPEGDVPRLSKMNGTSWKKAKAKAKASVENIAKDLIKLYAERKNGKGFAFAPDTPWQREFEEAFPYEETPDQLRAIREIKADMEKPEPMDRLLCGDVGFGKTEVAIRAAFKAVMNNKQVAILVPTTVLVQQHYQTFTNRFEHFGPKVGIICRFNSPKEQKKTLEELATGQIDVLIGTHAILNSKRVKFKDLGLLIVDEEQRFGVKQKEKIKRISKNIDVLALSATPIPRTLHMSLVGARDMSVIETPPQERFPIQTYVIENNDTIIRDAIIREIRRGGQIYFIYNRVETIEKMFLHLSALVPEAKICIAHGQMTEEELERSMLNFYEGKYDVLLATSIVENGLDVSNANTIIIYNADFFGLSQLYQMRGRVGRSTKMAFAYFIYQKDKILSETAEKRLQAIKEFAELGSGFKIAMRDLEIRGAGDLLGAQQHGHISSVGFEMYCHLLEEAVETLQTGEKPKEIIEPVIEIKTDAYLDGGYIFDATNKIEIYQRIAAIRNEDHAKHLEEELIDRFGPLTEPVKKLMQVARIKNYARDLGIKAISEKPAFVEFEFIPEPNIKSENMIALKEMFGNLLKLIPKQNLIQVKITPLNKDKLLNLIMRMLKVLAGEKIKPQLTTITEVKKPTNKHSKLKEKA